ncbi:MAG: hypothetical protein WB566_17530, partial [Terriglobales bacterium]
NETVRLASGCSGQYNVVTSTLANVLCESPVSGGKLRLRGMLSVAANAPNYDLTFQAEHVPLAAVVRLLRQAKKQIPGDLTASGALNAEFRAKRENGGATKVGATGVSPVQRRADAHLSLAQFLPQWTGGGQATNVRLSSNAGKDQVALGTIPLTVVSATMVANGSHRGRPSHAPLKDDRDVEEPAEAHLRIGPAAVVVNGSAPLNAGGWLSAAGYRFFLRGDVELQDLFRLENVLGLPVPRPAAQGSANLDMSLSGPWQGFAIPTALGTAQLRNIRAEMYSLNAPIEIGSATLSLDRDMTKMEKISARIGSAHWSGGVTAPRHCIISTSNPGAVSGIVPICVFQFDLTADQLSTGDLLQWFQPHPAKRPWYRILTNFNKTQGPSPLLAIQAHGDLRVGRFGLKNLLVTQVATQVVVDRGKIMLTSLHAQLLRGTHRGDWVIDTSRDAANRDATSQDESAYGASLQSNTPRVRYHGSGTLQDISLDQLSSLMNDGWITGTADGNFDVSGSANSFRELQAGSDGKLQFVMRNGSLPHVEIPGSPTPLPVHRFSGELRLTKGTWELSAARLESHDGIYQLSGTVSPDNQVDFILKRGDDLS